MNNQQVSHFNKTGEALFNAKIVSANLKAQKESEQNAFKQRARIAALETAQYLKPREPRTEEKAVIKKFNEWDVTKEAEKIYQWLIKVLK